MNIKPLEEFIDAIEVTDELSGDNKYFIIHNGNSIYIDFNNHDPGYYLLIIIIYELESYVIEKWDETYRVEYTTQSIDELLQKLHELLCD